MAIFLVFLNQNPKAKKYSVTTVPIAKIKTGIDKLYMFKYPLDKSTRKFERISDMYCKTSPLKYPIVVFDMAFVRYKKDK